MTLEASIEGKVVKAAQDAGWFVRKLSWIGRVGAPDRLFIRDGRVVFIEFKRPGRGRLSPRQKAELERMAAAGAEVHVIDDADHAFRVLGIR